MGENLKLQRLQSINLCASSVRSCIVMQQQNPRCWPRASLLCSVGKIFHCVHYLSAGLRIQSIDAILSYANFLGRPLLHKSRLYVVVAAALVVVVVVIIMVVTILIRRGPRTFHSWGEMGLLWGYIHHNRMVQSHFKISDPTASL
jgi:hypothetical protein